MRAAKLGSGGSSNDGSFAGSGGATLDSSLPDGADGPCVAPNAVHQRVSAGNQNGCAIKADQSVVCWGVAPASDSPTGLFVQIDSKISSNCGITVTGSISCWGAAQANGGAAVPQGSEFTQVSLGNSHACALDACGRITCWGDNTYGQTASPSGTHVQLCAGRGHSCSLTSAGTVVCWGRDAYGQADAPAGNFTYVTCGDEHTCAIRVDGTVACWGAGNATQVSDGSDPDGIFWGQSNPPGGTFTKVSAGFVTTCGISTSADSGSGNVVCWGSGKTSGNCATSLDACGMALPPPEDFLEAAVGYTHACGVRSAGTLACWGSDSGGRATPPTNFP